MFLEKGGSPLIEWEERGGLKAKGAAHPLPPDAEQGRRPGPSAVANPAAPGLGGGRDRRGKGKGVAGDRPPASPRVVVACRGSSAGVGGGGMKWFAAAALLRLERMRRWLGWLGRWRSDAGGAL